MADADKHLPFIAALMLAKKKGEDEGSDDDARGHDEDDAADQDHQKALSAMEDLIDAIHAKDAEKALDAYGDLCQLHHGDMLSPADDEES